MNKLDEIIKKGTEVRGEIQDMPYAPKGIAEWVMRTIPSVNYIMINKEEAYCSRCGTTYPANQLQNISARGTSKNGIYHKCLLDACPYCDEFGARTRHVAFFERYGKKAITEFARVVYLKTIGKKLYAVELFISIDYSKKPVSIMATIENIYITEGKNTKKFCKRYDYYDGPVSYKESKTVHVTKLYNGFGGETTYTHAGFYFKNAPAEIKKAKIRADINAFAEEFGVRERTGARMMMNYIRFSAKWPAIEMLWKYGMHDLVRDIVREESSQGLYIRQKNIRDILGVETFPEAEKMRDLNFGRRRLLLYHSLKKAGFTTAECDYINNRYPYQRQALEEIKRMTPNFTIKKFSEKYQSIISPDTYRDYLTECRLLGYDISNKNIAWPKDIIEAHRKTTELVKIQKDEITAKGIVKISQKFKNLSYSDDTLSIRPVGTLEELIAEGKKLKHCVGTYAERFSNGLTVIFAIRQKSAENKPFYTLELDPENFSIRQCRGLQNTNMTDEVHEFVDAWIEKIKKKKKGRKVA